MTVDRDRNGIWSYISTFQKEHQQKTVMRKQRGSNNKSTNKSGFPLKEQRE